MSSIGGVTCSNSEISFSENVYTLPFVSADGNDTKVFGGDGIRSLKLRILKIGDVTFTLSGLNDWVTAMSEEDFAGFGEIIVLCLSEKRPAMFRLTRSYEDDTFEELVLE